MSRQKEDKYQKKVKKKKHSPAGIYSCILSAVSFMLLLCAVAFSFLMEGKEIHFVGGAGMISAVLALWGCREAVRGRREAERNYITCRVGMGLNLVMLVILAFIFAGGI